MSDESDVKILKSYDEKKGLYEQFTKEIHSLISRLLKEKNFEVNSISFRPAVIKERSSLEKKLKKTDADYKTLEDIRPRKI